MRDRESKMNDDELFVDELLDDEIEGFDNNGYYDEDGVYRDDDGYCDEDGVYHEYTGYYDNNGEYHDYPGYIDEDGEFHKYEGFYDEDGIYHARVKREPAKREPAKNKPAERKTFKSELDENGYSRYKADRDPERISPKKSSHRKVKNDEERILTPGKVIGRIVLVLITFILITAGGAYFTMYNIVHGPSETAKNLFVSTIMETGQMKFLAHLYFTNDEIMEITSSNSMGTTNTAEVDTSLIQIGGNTDEVTGEGEDGTSSFDINGIEIVELTGRTYYAKMLIINDPSRVKLASIYDGSWKEYGKTLDEIVTAGDYLAGVNGGEYESSGNKGGQPKGLVVCEGEIQYNNPSAGDVMVGFNSDNILIIRDIGSMSASAVKDLVSELGIRDAVTFKDIDDGDDNHFTKLIINGEPREISGSGSGANPRTCIGQTADGTVLILVTDGRGSAGHLGATAADLLSIMQEYGAVNAANLDGGSSSAMYYDGEYEMTSVTLYYANSSWKLPVAFVVERRD